MWNRSGKGHSKILVERVLIPGSITLIVAGLDQWTGWWARHHLTQNRETWLVHPILGLQLLYNRGATLGIGARWPGFVTVVGILGTIFLTGWATTNKPLRLPLSVMAGGALGNVLSRLVTGSVTDFIRIMGWPGIFNLADVALRLGGLWLVIKLLTAGRLKSPGLLRHGHRS